VASKPRVTVVMAAHDDAPFLGAALDSVLGQTFGDFELIVVDDASTDTSREIVKRYRDPRVRLLVNATNLGGGATRNRGWAGGGGEYVANLDGNDVALPERLARQVAYLDAHPAVGAVGAQAIVIDAKGRRVGALWRPVTELGIRWCRIFQSPVIHSSAMFRRSVVGRYDERYRYGEDFDLFRRIATIHNLPETLAGYRVHAGSLTSTPGHPAREGWRERKAGMIVENLRETLRWSDVPRDRLEEWLAIENPRGVVEFLEECAARFAVVHGEDDDVGAHQAEMLIRIARRWPSPWLWAKIWRRHRRTALRTLPRLVVRAAVRGGR
jgi:glycosyltransferase involved in cell wall biosynthesis